MHQYFIYIVECRDSSYYTGVTNNVERRVAEHNSSTDPVGYTSQRQPVKLIYQHSFQWILDAITAEKQIKGWSRRKKEALIEGKLDLLPLLSENEKQRRIRSMRYFSRKYISTKLGVMLRPLEA